MSHEPYATEQDGGPGPRSQPLGWVAGDRAVFAGGWVGGRRLQGSGKTLQFANLLASSEPFHAPPTPISAPSL